MKHSFNCSRRAIALLLVTVLMMTMVSIPTAFATSTKYGKTTVDKVFVRKQAKDGGDYWFMVPTGWVGTVLGETDADGYHWYHVIVNGPDAPERTYWGYIRSDCFRYLTDEEEKAWEANPNQGTKSPATPTPTASSDTLTGYVKTYKNEVNLRLTIAGTVADQIPKAGVVLPYYGKPVSDSGYIWYNVYYNGGYYYLRSDVCNVTADGTGAVTPAPVTSAPVPTGSGKAEYVKTTVGKVNFRKAASMNGESMMWIESRETVVPVKGSAVTAGGYTWYPVTYAGKTGWLRGDCVVECDASGSTVHVDPTLVYGYIQLTKDAVNLRKKEAGPVIRQGLAINTVLAYYAAPTKKEGYTWYYVKLDDGTLGYIRSDCAKPYTGTVTPTPTGSTAAPTSTGSEFGTITLILDKVRLRKQPYGDELEWLGINTVLTLTAAPYVSGAYTWYPVTYKGKSGVIRSDCVYWNNPNPTPTPASGYIKLIKDKVNLRVKESGAVVKPNLPIGSVYAYYGNTTVKDNYTWYKVNVDGTEGFIRSDCVKRCNADGSDIGNPSPKPEASYTTLRKGSKGEAVKKLVAELKVQGYYFGAITDTYDQSVIDAVRAFQTAKGLLVDGVAGPATQHALFGTVPIGTNESVEYKQYPAEKIDWYSSPNVYDQVWPAGSTAIVVDVDTGLAFYAQRLFGSHHADAEPLRAQDTKTMCQIYGVSNAKQLVTEDHYERHAVWVIVEGRMFCGSMYGEPHGSYNIKDNNFDGQFCIHFLNSHTHGTDILDPTHQKMIEYAYQHADSRK